jgi:ABC-type glycerol-3-phosphate transport system permease component
MMLENKFILLPDIIGVPKSLKLSGFEAEILYESAITGTETLMIMAPLLIVFLFCQRYLVQGIERSGIVG